MLSEDKVTSQNAVYSYCPQLAPCCTLKFAKQCFCAKCPNLKRNMEKGCPKCDVMLIALNWLPAVLCLLQEKLLSNSFC